MLKSSPSWRNTAWTRPGPGADVGETQSLCPVCLGRIPARRVVRGGVVRLEKTCPEHGAFSIPVWRGRPDMADWTRPKTPSPPAAPATSRERGCPFDCGLCPEHGQHTCTVLVEVTARCSLRCPVCFAAAGGNGDGSADPTPEDLDELFRAARAAAGPCNLQLSGGEPAERDDLPDLVRRAKAAGFPFVQVNTNGLRLGASPEFARELRTAGLDSAFLQFDGTDDAAHRALRGRPLLAAKLAAVENLGRAGVGVVLVPTVVPGVNDQDLGNLLRLAAALSPAVRGVHFQPVSYFGRFPAPPRDADRITLPEIMAGLERQTGGLVRAGDFQPPGCEHALCSFHANYLVEEDGGLRLLTRRTCGCGPQPAAEGAAEARAFVARQWAAPAGPSTTQPADDLDRFLARASSHILAVSGMAFQDCWTLDLERLRGCCIHVADPRGGGRLAPFCAYNLTSSRGRPLYRSPLPGEELLRITPLDAWLAKRIGARPDPAALAAWQTRALRRTLAWARERSPFYARLLDGVDPSAVDLDTLDALPRTSAADLRDNDMSFLCVSRDEIARVVTLFSSGTTGPAKRTHFTAQDLESTLDFFHHGMATLAGPGSRVLILLPGDTPDSVGDLLARSLERLGAKGLRHGPVLDPAAAAEALARSGADCVVGLPAQVLSLTRGPHAARVRPGQVKSVLLCSDHAPRALARAVEEAWGCRVFTHWGSTESGLGGGVECDAREGYHLREADLLVEVTDPATGRRMPKGETGEVVFTTLARRGMPLVRYRTGDLAAWRRGPCPCGSVLRRLGPVRGRVDGAADLGRGQRLDICDLDEALFPLPGVLDFTARLDGDARSALLCVRLCAATGTETETQARAAAALEDLAAPLRAAGIRLDLAVGCNARPTTGKRKLDDRRR